MFAAQTFTGVCRFNSELQRGPMATGRAIDMVSALQRATPANLESQMRSAFRA